MKDDAMNLGSEDFQKFTMKDLDNYFEDTL